MDITIAKCLALYLWDPGNFPCLFSVVFQASTSKKIWGKNQENNHGTRKFDANHSANVKKFTRKAVFKNGTF